MPLRPEWVELVFHDRDTRKMSLEAARKCHKCQSCGHHPNAHVKGSCGVVIEQGNRKSKCGCGGKK